MAVIREQVREGEVGITITETCKLCGREITTARGRERSTKYFRYYDVAGVVEFKEECSKSPTGWHVVTGM